MKGFKLSPPWNTYRNQLAALFAQDPQITVSEIREVEGQKANYNIDVEVKSHEKFVALDRVLPQMISFGNVFVSVTLYDEENRTEGLPAVEIFRTIFKGNPIVRDVKEAVDLTGKHYGFVRFEPEVIQFFNDDLTDFNGNWSGLAEDIAKDVFNVNSSINFCTAPRIETSVAAPLGEWP